MRVMERIFQAELSCPRCGGTNVDALKPQGAVDFLLAMLRVYPYHCRRCYGDFHIAKIAQEVSPILEK